MIWRFNRLIFSNLACLARIGSLRAFALGLWAHLTGRREDALIAFTFDQFVKSGDETWPLLFPMVKSVVRAMDVVQALARSEFKQAIARFVVVGASKRGWATWLTAAVDPRLRAFDCGPRHPG